MLLCRGTALQVAATCHGEAAELKGSWHSGSTEMGIVDEILQLYTGGRLSRTSFLGCEEHVDHRC